MSTLAARVRAVVIDDHPFFRDGLIRGLTSSGVVEVVGDAGDGRSGLELIRRERPAVALVGYQMPELDGIALVQAVVRDELPTRLLLLSALTDSALVYSALEAGAAGYLAKDARRQQVVDAVLSVARGRTVVPEHLAEGLVDQIRLRAQSDRPVLSAREREVLSGFARGLSVPDLAIELYLSPSTVKTHVSRLYEKLSVSDRAAAVAEAMRRSLIE